MYISRLSRAGFSASLNTELGIVVVVVAVVVMVVVMMVVVVLLLVYNAMS